MKIVITDAARDFLKFLIKKHGKLMFHQSGGCCDGSSPMCYMRNEFKIGANDVLVGTIEDTPFYIGGKQFELWKNTDLTLDVVPGRGSSFSLDIPEGKRFIVRSDVCKVD